jgi:tRNA threonylcarbamoyladenosine biosynthesis protein TsaE
MATFISHNPEETQALGAAWAREVGEGWVIGLGGDLGAGKTQLVKGLARGLGAGTRVASPTFALVHEYRGGRLPLFHLDLYRLESREQIIAAGLETYLVRPEGVTVVEWVERWMGDAELDRWPKVASETRGGTPLPNPLPAGGAREPEVGGVRGLLWANSLGGRFRRVKFKILSDTEREIIHEDFGG